MAFSYWATLMSRSALATLRPAKVAPVLNRGRTTWGVKDQVSEPDLNSAESSLPMVPNPVVREMRGKKAARAAPMLALLAFRRFSAMRMSGRRIRASEGRPGVKSRSGARPSSPSGSHSAGTGAPARSVSAFSSRATMRV